MKQLFNILLLLLPLTTFAQKVSWENTTVNFGTVRDWDSPPAAFKFTNTGNQRLMFLPQKHGRDALVLYPTKAIQPGETGEIIIQYYTAGEGSFSKTVEVFTNASNRADRLTVKGNIKSIYANALTACPSFHEQAPARTTEPNVVQTVDAKTNLPIPNAQVEIFDRGIRKAINGTNLEGVAVNWIEQGKYIAVASKSGYEKAEEEVVFTKRNRSHVIYLNRTNAIAEEPVRISDGRFRTSDIVEDEIDLGIALNNQVEEENRQLPIEKLDLGITTNEILEEEAPKQTSSEEVEFNLGINSNSQWDEVIEVAEDRFQTSELIEEDLGVSTNDQLDEEIQQSEITNRQPVRREVQESQIERQVEAALAEAEVIDVAPKIESEPEFSSEKYRPNNVLLLLDVSGSMKDDDKMDKLKSSIRRLVLMLREVDVLTMIAYNSDSWELLPPTSVKDNQSIVALVDSLQPYGYTNGVKGMETAYESLEKQLIVGGNNQLIIATDGKFNSSKFSEQEAVQMVKDNSDKGIVLSIIGFGEDKEAGRLMKKLANLGNGNFLQVKTNEDPTELLAEEIKARSLKL